MNEAQSWGRLCTKKPAWALSSVAELVGCHPAKQKVASSIAGLGTYLGCRFGPWSGCT